jgi:hypothetical protein
MIKPGPTVYEKALLPPAKADRLLHLAREVQNHLSASEMLRAHQLESLVTTALKYEVLKC